ncbi:MAG TPA: ATPase, T2SS/T4P/T4SS family, partial [Thermoplasmata archaeon]|nr:ATPase, T2SS/T4P/T4SS family [Thermoplasmata archaeon]
MDILRYNVASPEMLAYLWLAVGEKKNLLVCGPTGSGKTTTWNILTSFIPRNAPTLLVRESKDGEDRSAEIRGSSAGFPKKLDYVLIQELRGREAHEALYQMADGQAICTTVEC